MSHERSGIARGLRNRDRGPADNEKRCGRVKTAHRTNWAKVINGPRWLNQDEQRRSRTRQGAYQLWAVLYACKIRPGSCNSLVWFMGCTHLIIASRANTCSSTRQPIPLTTQVLTHVGTAAPKDERTHEDHVGPCWNRCMGRRGHQAWCIPRLVSGCGGGLELGRRWNEHRIVLGRATESRSPRRIAIRSSF